MDTFTLILVATMGFVVVAGLGFVFAGGETSAATTKRLQAVSGGKDDKPKERSAADTTGVRRKQIVETLKLAEKQERRAKLTVASQLRQAGLRLSVRGFWIFCGGVGCVGFLAPLMLGSNILICLGAGFALGFGLPRWVLGFLIKRRIKKFTEEFPNATDVIVRGIKSGLPVHDCLKVIGRESPEPLAAEFRQVVEAASMGMSLDEALEKMYERMPTSEVRFFSIVLSIQSKSGGNLAEALGNLSAVLRARKLMVEKIKAMSGEAVASAWIIGVLPPGVMAMVMLTNPKYMMPMFTDHRGHLLLLGAGIWMSLGVFIMRRMINFKF